MLEQDRQLAALQLEQLDRLAVLFTDELLPDDMAKSDTMRSTLLSLHFGQQTESISFNEHNSSNSLSHLMQWNSYIGIKNHPLKKKNLEQRKLR